MYSHCAGSTRLPSAAFSRLICRSEEGHLPSAIRALDQVDIGLANEHEGVIFLAGLQLTDSKVAVGTSEDDVELAALLVLRLRLEVERHDDELPESASRRNMSGGIDQCKASGLVIRNDRDGDAIGGTTQNGLVGDVAGSIILPELDTVEAPALAFPIESRHAGNLKGLDHVFPDAGLTLSSPFVGLRRAGRQVDPGRMGLDGEGRADALDALLHDRLIDEQRRLRRFVVREMGGRRVRNTLIDETRGGVRTRASRPGILLVLAEAISKASILALPFGIIEGEVPLVD